MQIVQNGQSELTQGNALQNMSLVNYNLGCLRWGLSPTLAVFEPRIFQLPLNRSLQRRRIAQGCVEVDLAISA